jgi:hypothetical protein
MLRSLLPGVADTAVVPRGALSQHLERSLFVVMAAFGKCVRGQIQLPLQTKVENHKLFSMQLPSSILFVLLHCCR